MRSHYLAATRTDQRKVFNGHHSRQVTGEADRHDHSTHPLPIKILNTTWQLIDLSITFSIGRINYFLASSWQSRSCWANIHIQWG